MAGLLAKHPTTEILILYVVQHSMKQVDIITAYISIHT